jgi:hypothetical protein
LGREELLLDPLDQCPALSVGRLQFVSRRHLAELELVEDFLPTLADDEILSNRQRQIIEVPIALADISTIVAIEAVPGEKCLGLCEC